MDFFSTNNILVLLLLIVSLFFVTLIAYLKTTPEHIENQTRIRYNFFVFSLALFACFIIYIYTYLNNGLSYERAVFSLLAYLQSLLVSSIVLIVGGLFRNLLIFRKK